MYRECFNKLATLQCELTKWAKRVIQKRSDLKLKLQQKLETLLDTKRDEETLNELLDTKFQLSLEVEKRFFRSNEPIG